jgi:PPP family 3-phenylpropionic acid transporter
VIRIFLKIPQVDGFALRTATLYAAFFAFAGIQMPYLPAWLAAKGLDAREIGIVLATPMLIRVVAVPLATRLIDRRFEIKAALTVAAALSAALYATMGAASGFAAITAAYAAISIVSSPVLPLADSYALRGLNARGLAYGPVRLWGSVTFILANVAGGIFLAVIGAQPLVWVLAAAMVMTAAATLPLPSRPAPDEPAFAAKKSDGGGLWGSAVFMSVAAGASLIQASHAVMYGFATLQWSAKGLAGTTIGLLWAIGVVAGVVVAKATVPPGASFGWHSHRAAVAVVVKSGTLTLYDSADKSCTPQRYSAGQGFVEHRNHVHLARNEGRKPVVILVTYLGLKHGVNPDVPSAKPGNCPF